MAPSIPAITLEEHFLTAASAEKLDSGEHSTIGFLSGLTGRNLRTGLVDVGALRMQSMDEANISRQIVSHINMVPPTPSEAAAINDELCRTTRAHPARFAGFAALPLSDPEAAARELKRAVTDLGFVEALVENHVADRYYDDGSFWPVFQQAVELDVPIYIHPTFPTEEMIRVNYRGNYDQASASSIGAWVFGWHAEVAVHILRLYASGFFDVHPKIKLVIGHMGETLPFMIARIQQWEAGFKEVKRSFVDVWRTNIYVTTSGFFTLPPLRCLLDTMPVDHIMYSVDYPFNTNEEGASFLEQIEKERVFDGYGGGRSLSRIREGKCGEVVQAEIEEPRRALYGSKLL
ncbi:hypothetical protein SLS56_004947 [Neofusicoccum ribis]|uniref:Amidohydrolase-related domain-containing protein n=1 Tax=Neofusicoccum ribis TaxID=45134 RepID=A0ABR3SV31_9PEZI